MSESTSATVETSASRPVVLPPQGGRLTPWQKGQSGNPSGVGLGEYHTVRKLCKERSVAATKRLFELMESDDQRVAFLAIKEIYDRGIGKPREHNDDQGGRIDLSALSPDERQAMVEMLKKAMGL